MSPWARMQCTKLTCTDDWLAVAESKIPAVYGRSYVEFHRLGFQALENSKIMVFKIPFL